MHKINTKKINQLFPISEDEDRVVRMWSYDQQSACSLFFNNKSVIKNIFESLVKESSEQTVGFVTFLIRYLVYFNKVMRDELSVFY